MVYSPTPQDLAKALDDVYYEIQQLAYTTIVPPGSEARLNNAILESRLLHVRNLLDFFEHSPGANDDVLAAHYDFVASRVPLEDSYRERLNKDLAHLTYSRTSRSETDKEWPPDRVIRPIIDRCFLFIQHLLANTSSLGSRSQDGWQMLLLELTRVTELLSLSTSNPGIHPTARKAGGG